MKQDFATLNTDLDIIQKLGDLPNAVDGLTAAELKKKFDDAGNAIKDYINNNLLPQLANVTPGNAGASKIGLEEFVELPGVNNLQDAVSALLANFQQGTIDYVTAAMLTAGCVETAALADGAVTGAKTDFSSGLAVSGALSTASLTNAGTLTQQGELILDSDCYGNSTTGQTPTAGRIFFVKL